MVDKIYPNSVFCARGRDHQNQCLREWLDGLKDLKARAKILTRIDRMALGSPGAVGAVGGGISEMKIDFGPGYRVYFMQRGRFLVVLLAGGDKSTQSQDIDLAKAVVAEWKDEQ